MGVPTGELDVTQTGKLDVTDADSLLDALALASAAEVTPNRWFVNRQDFISLRKLKDGNQRYARMMSPKTPSRDCSASPSPSRKS